MASRLISRRNFLRNTGCAALGSTTLMNTLTNLKFINSAATLGDFNDYKALVVIMMSGGNDSYNMLVPFGDTEHAEYVNTRTDLALPKVDPLDSSRNLRDLEYTDVNGRQLGLHYSLSNMETLFKNGNLSFVSNIGTLVEPTNKTQLYDNSVSLPLGLYSHSDQALHWQTALPQERIAQGWGGKIADMFTACNDNENISLNLSFAGNNVYQTGQSTVEYSLRPGSGAVELQGIEAPWEIPTARRNTINSMMDQYYDDIFKRTYVDVVRTGKEGAMEFNEAIDGITLNTEFTTGEYNTAGYEASANYLGETFETIAKTIAARDTLGMKRQIFFIDIGGFDMHEEVLNSHEALLSVLDTGLGEFYDALEELGMTNNVTTFSLSEFARTLTSNGEGSDHAWGSNAFIMGGAVNGGEIFGTYPSLALDAELEVGGGVLIPTTATDQYFGDIASWFGVENSELIELFPNIDNFDSIYNGNPLGLLM